MSEIKECDPGCLNLGETSSSIELVDYPVFRWVSPKLFHLTHVYSFNWCGLCAYCIPGVMGSVKEIEVKVNLGNLKSLQWILFQQLKHGKHLETNKRIKNNSYPHE